jgi:lipid-A-disaccharide synthase
MALGGDRMAAAGATLLGNTSSIGSVGLIESLPFVLPTLRVQQRAKQYLRTHPPDVVVLIDYLGPNLGMGQFIRATFPSVPQVYYIAPQEWVWSFGSQNTRRLVTMVDQLLAIFPEEARYYQHHGAQVTWVGHPLVDRMASVPNHADARAQLGISDDQKAIALVPASRRQEIRDLMPILFGAARRIQDRLPAVKFWIPLSLDAYRPAIEQAIQQYRLNATIVTDDARVILSAADLAIAKSGTVNLETAILNTPQVVAYRVHPITAWIARHILKFSIPFMSPPNLVNMEAVVPEFLQEDANPDAIADTALELLINEEKRHVMLNGYQRMRDALGTPGVCDRAATAILNTL